MKKFIILLVFIKLSLIVFAQDNLRRHFIIAYDVSTPFKNAERQTPVFKQALIDLFSNNSISGFNEANQDNLLTEKNNNVIFFDKEKDDISFFHFNVARSEFGNLRMVAQNYGENKIIESFTEYFIKDKVFNWNTYKSGNNYVTPSDYIKTAFTIQPEPTNFDGGVSMSNFVYPLILDKLERTTYAEEYVLILLSDFLTGSMLGNNKDLDRVRDIYSVPYNTILPFNSPVTYIKKRIDYLASQYYKMDYFQYSFLSNHNNKIAIIVFKIKPKIGVLTPEDVALFVNSNLDLYQKSYQSSQFKTSETKIKFTHNKNLVPVELQMTIALPLENGDEQIIFDDVIATKNEAGNWISNYTSDNDLMNFDEDALTYHIPKLNIELDSIVNKQNFENLIVRYLFKAKYEVPDLQPVGFLYKTERLLSIDNIIFKTETSIIIMNYVLLPLSILLLIFIVILIFANRGKPQGLRFTIQRYLDSFEKTDYHTEGKLITDYKSWNYELQKEDFLPVSGVIKYNSQTYPLNWKSKVRLQLIVERLPNGFELFLKKSVGDISEFSKDYPMFILPEKRGKLSFWIGIRQTDVTKQIDEPELVKFSIETVIQDSRWLFVKSKIRKTIPYLFHIGADLQDVWVAFDPGTTGSCVAVGSEADNIRLLDKENKNTDGIVPSVITFNTEENYNGQYCHYLCLLFLLILHFLFLIVSNL